MHVGTARPAGWRARWLFERALARVYAIAFTSATLQFVPLLGEHGLEPIGPWVDAVPFLSSPSLFYLAPKDIVFRTAGWIGVAVSLVVVTGCRSASGGWRRPRHGGCCLDYYFETQPMPNPLSWYFHWMPFRAAAHRQRLWGVRHDHTRTVRDRLRGDRQRRPRRRRGVARLRGGRKPGDPAGLPPQVAPYHLRLGWMS
jgi:hypothetical protein